MDKAVFFPLPNEEVISLDDDYWRETLQRRFGLFEQSAAGLFRLEMNFDDVSPLHGCFPTINAHFRSNRSKFITLSHAATKSRTNFSCESAQP